MSTLQKFAALPIDQYIDILEKLKGIKDKAPPASQTHSPVSYQDGAGSDNEIIGQSAPHQSSAKSTAPPPGLPVADDLLNDSSEGVESDNWIDVWQALK